MAKAKVNNNFNVTDNYFYVKGTILSPCMDKAVRGTHEKDKRVCYRYTIKDPVFNGDDIITFVTERYDVNDKFTPKWIKAIINGDRPEYINFKSEFPLVAKTKDEGVEVAIDDLSIINNGASGYFNVHFKTDNENTTAYLCGFLMVENGTPRNMFDGCDF